MKIIEKIKEKQNNIWENGEVTIAFLGDSVTQGCFEVYSDGKEIGVVFDEEAAYHNCFRKILSYLYPKVPVNIIKAGISGNSAPNGLTRLERDVLRFQPDLAVVCFGLNDVVNGIEGIGRYKEALGGIFTKLKEKEIEVIFMTPNMCSTYTSPFLEGEQLKEIAENLAKLQNEGTMDLYMEAAVVTCREHDITVCDCYKKWKKMEENGVDTTSLLSNHINHPTREMSWLFAALLVKTIMEE